MYTLYPSPQKSNQTEATEKKYMHAAIKLTQSQLLNPYKITTPNITDQVEPRGGRVRAGRVAREVRRGARSPRQPHLANCAAVLTCPHTS